jgi:hypothetical protein
MAEAIAEFEGIVRWRENPTPRTTAPLSGAEERGGVTTVLHNWKGIPKLYPTPSTKCEFLASAKPPKSASTIHFNCDAISFNGTNVVI